MTVTAEGDLFLEDQNFESLKNRTLTAASPIDSLMPKRRQAKSYVFC